MKKARITVIGLMGNSVFMNVPHFHSPGETVISSSLHIEPGGKGCNQAVAAARLGAEVCFFSCMGRDSTASDCTAFMENEGILCRTEYADSQNSPYACILTDRTGENQVTVSPGSAGYLSPEFIKENEKYIASADILLLNNETPFETNLAALTAAEKHGVKTVLNPAPFKALPADYLKRFYLITPNKYEACRIADLPSDCDDFLPAKALSDMGIQQSIVTLGRNGCVAAKNGVLKKFDAPKVASVDTTGAGDCFNGALCCALAEDMSMEKAIGFSICASAYSVTKKYVMPSLPYRAVIDALY